jgi:DNA-binding beta-propeller fold protein YncE
MGTCCAAAPPVIEFDAQGKVVQGWGQGSMDDTSNWPRDPHGIFVDHNDFVWIGTYKHDRVMKFTRDGKLLMTIGQYDKNAGSNDTTLLGGPAGIWVDSKTNEVYIADGYRNRRVIVFDGATGKYLRHWGAYGGKPDDTEKFDPKTMVSGALPKQFSTVHGLTGSKDGKIYVADRRGNRIQVFDHEGKFITEKVIAPATLSSGSAFVIVLSPDAQEQWLYLADGTNHKIWILRRSDLEVVGEFGHGGRQAGQMLRPHGMSIDAQGNLYVGEASTGRRVQKFVLQRAR